MKPSSYFPELENAVNKMDTSNSKSLKKVRIKLEKKCAEIESEDLGDQDEVLMKNWVSWAQARILWIKSMERYEDVPGNNGENRR